MSTKPWALLLLIHIKSHIPSKQKYKSLTTNKTKTGFANYNSTAFVLTVYASAYVNKIITPSRYY